jgi:PAS domain S-box-containing protein
VSVGEITSERKPDSFPTHRQHTIIKDFFGAVTGNRSYSILLERFELRRFFAWPMRERGAGRDVAYYPLDAGADIQVLKGLQARERTLRNLLEALPTAVCATDADGRITFYNQAAVEMWGHRPELGKTKWCGSWKLYWPDGRPMPHDESPIAIAINENRPMRGFEAIAERPDGSRVSFCPYPTPLHDDAGRLVGAVNVLVDITPHKEAEERLKLMACELHHRANNIWALVQTTVRLTTGKTIAKVKAAIEGRIGALAHVHGLLSESRWLGTTFEQLVQRELAPYCGGGQEDRVEVRGSTVTLAPTAAQTMAMALHELATNAAKHGSLSTPVGQVRVEWSAANGKLAVRWSEVGGPRVRRPKRFGFGSRLLEMSIRDLGGDISFEWRRAGLICEITINICGPER